MFSFKIPVLLIFGFFSQCTIKIHGKPCDCDFGLLGGGITGECGADFGGSFGLDFGGGREKSIPVSSPVSFSPIPQSVPFRIPSSSSPPPQSVTIPNIIIALLPPKPPVVKSSPQQLPVRPPPPVWPFPQPYTMPINDCGYDFLPVGEECGCY